MDKLNKPTNSLKRSEVSSLSIDIQEVTTGNIITFNLYDHEEKENEVFTLKLVDSLKGNEKEISVNSPVGQNIYRKTVGESITYFLNSRKFTVTILDIQKAV